ncbi:unnamed protein product [Closterium sp. NIES-54]
MTTPAQYVCPDLSDKDSISENNPPSAYSSKICRISFVCRRWRALESRYVSTLVVKSGLLTSSQDLALALSSLPNLTYLLLNVNGVESIDDAFLTHLASSCPKLTALYLGSRDTEQPFESEAKLPHPITQGGLDNFFQRCTQHEWLSLSCLYPGVQLPPSFFQLSRLKRFPDSFGESMPCLRKLTIDYCERLEHLPDGITSLKHLTSLVISNCLKLVSLPENFGRLTSLKSLVLARLSLSGLPDSFFQLSSLETLFLHWWERILQLPAEFCCLTALRTLCLDHVTLPEDIGHLSRLHTLFVSSCSMKHFPSSLTEISSLRRLELDFCRVKELPEGLGELRTLRELHISSCFRLVSVPASVTCLTGLEILTIANCRSLSSIPSSLETLTQLKRLSITSCNRLPSVLPASLEILSLDGSDRSTFLPDISVLTNLWKVSLKVSVECGHSVSRRMSHLRHIELSLAREAEELPFALAFVPRLLSLIILHCGSVRRLPEDFGLALPQLRKLKIKCAEALEELPTSIIELRQLTFMKLEHASALSSLPYNIGALPKLRDLQLLDCTELQSLPDSLTQLSCLRELTICVTSIRFLPPNFARLTQLRTLSLSGCFYLQVLPEDLTELKMLQRLDLRRCAHVIGHDGTVVPHSISEMHGLSIEYDVDCWTEN